MKKNLLKNVRLLISFMKSRTFAVGLLSAVLAFTVYSVSMRTYAVYIRDGEDVVLKFTMSENPQDILEENGITTIAADVVDFTGFTEKTGEIKIKRTFPVNVYVDQEVHCIMVAEGTVKDVIKKSGVVLGNDDEINMPLKKPVKDGDIIRINRVRYETTKETKKVPFETTTERTSSLIKGVKKLSSKGQYGERQLTYKHKIIDGVRQEPELISDNIIKEPVNEKYIIGTKKTISPLDFGYTLKGNVPSSYSKVITNAKATGYSAKPGASTASGRPAKVGHVAVNPDVIPYGTKLYIASPDGKFVYGYAIAADTGVALLDGRVDVDLFYDTYEESCQNGVKWVNIYILD